MSPARGWLGGSTFTLELDAAEEPARAAAHEGAGQVPGIEGLCVVLQVGDAPASAQLVEAALAESGAVVFLSADARPDQIERAIELGASAYLTKPLDLARLRRTLSAVCASLH